MSEAEQVATAFLDAVERRDADACRALMAPEMAMVFPGGVRHASIEALFAASAKRYRRVGKTITTVEGFAKDGIAVVYCHGTLHGQWINGRDFDGIRFIDRFEIKERLIVRQDVWNDAAIFRPAGA